MKKIIQIFSVACFFINVSFASDSTSFKSEEITIKVSDGELSSTFLHPNVSSDVPAVLIIAGSGPTDRNGNNAFMQNNSLKMLAEELAAYNIASLRYDKRGIGQSNGFNIIEDSLRFEDYINDAKMCLNQLSNHKGISKVFIAGHSEGSLIGMIVAADSETAGYISLAGMGEPIHATILRQLESQPKYIKDTATIIMNELIEGNFVSEIDPMLNSIFRPSLQPFLMSFFKYDPEELIKKVSIPTLIIQGNTDIQVRVEDAEILKRALPSSQLAIVDSMNHIFKYSEMNRMKNLSTYNQSDLPLIPEFIPLLVQFINQH